MFQRSSAFIAAMLAANLASAFAQDPLQVGPDIYKLVFENEHVRVLDVHFQPGAKVAMHAHPDHLVYIASGEELTLSYLDGSTKKMTGKPGDMLWVKAESHAAQNTSGHEVTGAVIELKDAPERAATQPADRTGPDPVKLTPEAYKVPLDNERVRVLDVHLTAGGKLPMHAHPDHLVYALAGGKARFTSPDGRSNDAEIKAGQVMWHATESHAVENIGTGELHVLDIELKPPTRK